jgi:hypothetical protein
MNQIQTTSSEFSMYNSLVENCFPVILVLFLGVWSDHKKRRKPTLILSLSGKFLRTLGLLLNAYFISWPSYVLLITAALPHSLGGANAVFQMSAFSYISDSSEPNSRTWRISVVEFFWYLGTPVGLSLGVYLFEVGGYLSVFGASCALHLIGVLYTLFVLPEVPRQHLRSLIVGSHYNYGTEIPRSNRISDETSGKPEIYSNNNEKQILLPKLQSSDPKEANHVVYDVSPVKFDTAEENSTVYELVLGSVRSFVKRRPNFKRECLLALASIMLLAFTASHGESSMKYLFTRNKFGWREQEFSVWTIFEAAMAVLGLTVIMPLLNKVLKLSDPLLGLVGAFSRMSSRLCYALAPTSTFLYIGSALDSGGVMSALAARSLASKSVPRHERGRVFAFLGCIEALVPFFAVPIYSFIYTHTLKSLPSSIYYTSFAIYAFISIIFGLILTGLKLKLIGFSDSDSELESQTNHRPEIPSHSNSLPVFQPPVNLLRQDSSKNSKIITQ